MKGMTVGYVVNGYVGGVMVEASDGVLYFAGLGSLFATRAAARRAIRRTCVHARKRGLAWYENEYHIVRVIQRKEG